jgi:hypothetical protein
MLCVASCSSRDPVGIAKPVTANCPNQELENRFFGDVFSGRNELKRAGVQGVPELLASFGEPSLSCAVHVSEAYRLVYMPERGDTLTIRAERHQSTYTVTVVSANSQSGAPNRRNDSLDSGAWSTLTNAISTYNFWSRSPYPTQSTIDRNVIVVHGQLWLLEGQNDGWYHAVSRASGSKEQDFDLPARTMFEIAGLEVPGIVKPRY